MWLIAMAIRVGVMLGGHALMNGGHGSHSHEAAAVHEPVAATSAPDGGAADAAPDNAPHRRHQGHRQEEHTE